MFNAKKQSYLWRTLRLFSALREKINKAVPENGFGLFIRRYAYLFIFVINIIMLDLVFRIVYRGAGYILFLVNKIPILFTLMWCLILTGIAWILPGIIKRIYIVLITSFYVLLVLVHCGMYSFKGKFFSFADMMFADDGAKFFSFDYIYIRKIMLLLAFACVAASVFAAIIAPKKEKYKPVRIISSILAVAIGITGIFMIEDAWLSDYVSVSWDSYKKESDLYQSFTDTGNCMLLTGLYQYTMRDFYLSSNLENLFNDNKEAIEKVTEYYAQRELDPDNEMTGIFKGKNLLLIQLEAIDTWMVNETAMPNLSKIKSESIDFINHYAPLYLSGGTFNTEIMVNLGFIPPFYGSKTGVYAGNDFPYSIANLFKKEGYVANSFHNSRDQVYSRGIVHVNWGYEKYYSGERMGMPNIELDSDLLAGFDLMTANGTGDKFFSFIITYSGHGAYLGSEVSEIHYDRFTALYPEGTDEMYIHAMAHAYETDLFVGKLFDALKEADLIDDTVVIFYSDHYNYYVLDDSLVMKYKGVYDENLIKNVPFFIWSSDTEPMTVDKVTATYDILPTIVNLFDLDNDGRYYAGNDAFSDKGGYVIFEDLSWYDGKAYYKVSENNQNIDDFIKARNSEISKRVPFSNRILLLDYFRAIKKN